MATTTEHRISWGELRARAHHVRTRSIAAGEAGLSMRVADLLELLPLPYDPEPLPDDATEEEILEAEREPLDFAEDVLKRHGVRCRPAPGDVGRDGVLVVRPSNRFAVQGALALGLLALIAGAVVSKIAFAGFLPFVIVGVWLAWRQSHLIDRWAPRIVPRGRILGALVMLILLAIASVSVVLPGRAVVRERGERTNALALTAQANALLDAGDVAGARGAINGALVQAPDLGEVQVARDRVLVAEINANANSQAAAGAAYTRAESALADGQWQRAIDELTALGGYADAPARVAAIRTEAAEATITEARRALRAGDPSRAFELYGDAVSFDPASADPTLIKEISAALSGA